MGGQKEGTVLGDPHSMVEMVGRGKCVQDVLALPQTELCVAVCGDGRRLKSVLTCLYNAPPRCATLV